MSVLQPKPLSKTEKNDPQSKQSCSFATFCLQKAPETLPMVPPVYKRFFPWLGNRVGK